MLRNTPDGSSVPSDMPSSISSPTDSILSPNDVSNERNALLSNHDFKQYKLTPRRENDIHLVQQYFLNYVLLEKPIPENACRKLTRRIVISFALGIASISGVPYIAPSRDAFGEYTTLGWIAAGATIISFAAGSSWAWLKIMRELDPQSPEEVELYRGKHGRKIRLLQANVLGALATLPPAYAVYKLNDNLIYPIIGFFAGVATNIYALYKVYDGKKLINQMRQCVKKTCFHKNGQDLNLVLIDDLSKILENAPILYLNTRASQRNLIMPSLFNTQFMDAQQAFEGFVKEAIQLRLLHANAMQNEKWLNGWPKFIAKGISAIFPIAFSIVNARLSYESSLLIYAAFLFNLLYVLLTVVPYMSIEFIAAAKTFESLYEKIFNLATRQGLSSLSHHYYPKLNKMGFISSAILGVIPATSRIYITLKTIEGTGQLPLTIIGALGGTIFQSFVLFDFFHTLLIGYSQLQTHQIDQKKIASFMQRMEKFMQIFETLELAQLNTLVSGSNSQYLRNLLLEYHTVKNHQGSILLEDRHEVRTINANEEKSPAIRPAPPSRVSACERITSFFFRRAPVANSQPDNPVTNESSCRIC